MSSFKYGKAQFIEKKKEKKETKYKDTFCLTMIQYFLNELRKKNACAFPLM